MSDEWTPERIAELRQHLDAGVPTWIQDEELSSLLDALEEACGEALIALAQRDSLWAQLNEAHRRLHEAGREAEAVREQLALRLNSGRVCLESIRETDSKDVIMYGVRDALKALG